MFFLEASSSCSKFISYAYCAAHQVTIGSNINNNNYYIGIQIADISDIYTLLYILKNNYFIQALTDAQWFPQDANKKERTVIYIPLLLFLLLLLPVLLFLFSPFLISLSLGCCYWKWHG